MNSIKEIFKIGYGPSSSHTMGPSKAAQEFLKLQPEAASYKVVLYGSLAATGKGHFTDVALIKQFAPQKVEIEWKPEVFLPAHPNGMDFFAYNEDNQEICHQTYYSIGGGDISLTGQRQESQHVYKLTTMNDILEYLGNMRIWEYVSECEGNDIWDYLATVWQKMRHVIKSGMEHESTLPGCIKLPRKASTVYSRLAGMDEPLRRRYSTMVYAFAVAEENASCHEVVTAPTCGSCGVLPAALYTMEVYHGASEKKILHALATAGIIGNLIKTNASISGAEVGCQGEVGVACAMAAGAVAQLLGGSARQIEYAAEMGLEHHLGLTCDPVCGLVQVPCIERNAFAACRAIDAAMYSLFTDGQHIISFDKVVQVMKVTGHDLPSLYKETSTGGLAV